nr:uncharacterized protein LOC118972388 isoform X2 [Manis javanica]
MNNPTKGVRRPRGEWTRPPPVPPRGRTGHWRRWRARSRGARARVWARPARYARGRRRCLIFLRRETCSAPAGPAFQPRPAARPAPRIPPPPPSGWAPRDPRACAPERRLSPAEPEAQDWGPPGRPTTQQRREGVQRYPHRKKRRGSWAEGCSASENHRPC